MTISRKVSSSQKAALPKTGFQNAELQKTAFQKAVSRKAGQAVGMLLLGLISSGFSIVSAAPSAAPTASVGQFVNGWSGGFDQQKIAVFIESIQQGRVRGYSVLGKTRQNFDGNLTSIGQNKYRIVATETGQPATAGIFTLQLDLNQPKRIEGSWQSSKGTVKPKFFALTPTQCRYAAGAGDYPQASSRLLKDADLQVSKPALSYMRNEIYARHQYSFANKTIASQFADISWYSPCFVNVANKLSRIEQENIRRIKLMEPYAENVEVEWGR